MSRFLLDKNELAILRRAYARQMLASVGVSNNRLEQAFATVPREAFLGSAPWCIVRRPPGPALPANDPVYVYQDVVIALAPERGVNNGSPSLHARMMNDLAVEPGQHIAHVGAGAGYYTAILAELTGASGRVIAVEYDQRLADAARANLAGWSNVTVICGDGGAALNEAVDGIYVNFAVCAPARAWTENLKPGGKLLFQLGAPHPEAAAGFPRHSAQGGAFLISRTSSGFRARYLYPAYFVCAEGAFFVGTDAEQVLFDAFQRGGFERVNSLIRDQQADPTQCWYCTHHWGLSYGTA